MFRFIGYTAIDKNPGRDRQALGTRTPRVPGGRKGGRPGSEIAGLVRRRVAELIPQDRIPASSATIGAPLRPVDENASGNEKVSEHVYLVYQHGWT